jgi:hypothetical protein
MPVRLLLAIVMPVLLLVAIVMPVRLLLAIVMPVRFPDRHYNDQKKTDGHCNG